jgi:hypothetical protein
MLIILPVSLTFVLSGAFDFATCALLIKRPDARLRPLQRAVGWPSRCPWSLDQIALLPSTVAIVVMVFQLRVAAIRRLAALATQTL